MYFTNEVWTLIISRKDAKAQSLFVFLRDLAPLRENQTNFAI